MFLSHLLTEVGGRGVEILRSRPLRREKREIEEEEAQGGERKNKGCEIAENEEDT